MSEEKGKFLIELDLDNIPRTFETETLDGLSTDEMRELLTSKGIPFKEHIAAPPKPELNISFDFDSTLTEKPMQELCKKYIDLGANVFITTSRGEKTYGGKELDNSDLFQLADKLNIKRENIIFTNYEDKYLHLKGIDVHVDDDIEEVFLINGHPNKCIGFLYEEKPNNGIANF